MNIDLEAMKVNTFENEQQLQAASIMLISQNFPQLRDKVWHTKNEGYIPKMPGESKDVYKRRCMMEGNRNKAQGMLSGVHDILCNHMGILHKLELKMPGEYTSDSQRKIHQLWDSESPIKTTIGYNLFDTYMWAVGVLNCPYEIRLKP